MAQVRKRNGNLVDFDPKKIATAILRAMREGGPNTVDEEVADRIAQECYIVLGGQDVIDIEEIQDYVEIQLMTHAPHVAKRYIIYRLERQRLRQQGWEMTDLQRDIFINKYQYKNESFDEFLERISGGNQAIKKMTRDKKFIPAGRILAGRGLDEDGRKITLSNCFTPGTRVLTENGYKSIEDVVIGERVLTGDGTYQLVNAVMKNEYEGDLIVFDKAYVNNTIKCTPNHKIKTQRGWETAENIYRVNRRGREQSQFQGVKAQPTYNFIEEIIDLKQIMEHYNRKYIIKENQLYCRTDFVNQRGGLSYDSHRFGSGINEYVTLNKEVMYLLGRYLGDGSVTVRTTSHYNTPSIFQLVFNAKTEQQDYDFCKQVLENNFGVVVTDNSNPDQNTLVLKVNSEPLSCFFDYLVGRKENKHIPEKYINNIDLLIGILDSDGYIVQTGKNPAVRLVLKNEKLLKSVAQGLQNNGFIISNVQEVFNGKNKQYSAWKFQLTVDESKKLIPLMNKRYEDNRHIVEGDSSDTTPLRKPEKEFYQGYVYNLSVENNHEYFVEGVLVHNCYVLPKVEDNLESIFDTAKNMARTYSYGGGVGVNISKLRPRGAKVHNAAKTTSGAVSFMDLYSLTTGLIGQQGRRGALMLNMDVSHPDIEEFLNVKNDLTKVTKANISVNVTDEFMIAVKNDDLFTLRFQVEGGEYITKEVEANVIYEQLCYNNWNMAEPGMLFSDRLDNWHLMSEDPNFEYAGVNPCAEEPLPAYGSCNLSSINLGEFVRNPFTDKAEIDYYSLRQAVREGIIYLNEILDENTPLHPLREQEVISSELRQIGLGIMGVADMFIKLSIRYGSKESLDLTDQVGRILINEALQQSALLAAEHGPFPRYNAEYILKSPFLQANADPDTLELIKEHGLYNSQLLTIAPTGSISTLIGASNGIEPLFQISYTRKTESLHGGQDMYYKVVTPVVKEFMLLNEISDEDDLPDTIVTTSNLHWEDRINVQSRWQQYIDAAISSTINLPEDTTVREVADIYMYAWEQGLKGVTIYRDNCARAGILIVDKKPKGTIQDRIADLQEKINELAVDSLKENPHECPICGGKMNVSGGCEECQDCGYSPCSV